MEIKEDAVSIKFINILNFRDLFFNIIYSPNSYSEIHKINRFNAAHLHTELKISIPNIIRGYNIIKAPIFLKLWINNSYLSQIVIKSK